MCEKLPAVITAKAFLNVNFGEKNDHSNHNQNLLNLHIYERVKRITDESMTTTTTTKTTTITTNKTQSDICDFNFNMPRQYNKNYGHGTDNHDRHDNSSFNISFEL